MTATSTDLVEVTIETTLGARYVFPDMPRRVLEHIVKAESSSVSRVPSLTLVNVSDSVLVLPSRIVKSISFDGEVKWRNAAVRELPDSG